MKKKQFFLFLITLLFCQCDIIAQTNNIVNAKNNENVDSLPSVPFLPDPLITNEGKIISSPITQSTQWKAKCNWIKEQYQHWICGTVPPAPKIFTFKIISEKKEPGVLIRMVELHFGPEQKGKLTVELMIPTSSKRLPVFMTQWNHRGWAQIAVRRGYIGCVYAGADDKDDTQNFDSLYTGYSFSTLMKRAWAASRAIDYLYSLKEVDTSRIGITGHSRNAKQSLLAAAFDDRIKAVVSSSGGTGGENPFRYTDESFNNESINDITTNFPDWFHPNLRLFIGKEEKLPVDQNSLMSLIAPRGLMLSTALNETEGGPWGIEQAYLSAKKVYKFYKAENNLGIFYRNGRHATSARDIEKYIDFFDYVFWRTNKTPENSLYYDYSFSKWKKQSKEQINPLHFPTFTTGKKNINEPGFSSTQEEIKKKINWLLGEEPPGIPANEKILCEEARSSGDYLGLVINEPEPGADIRKCVIGPYNAAGENLWADMYYQKDVDLPNNSSNNKHPLIIFLHEYAHTNGYRYRTENLINTFTKKGFLVLCFDMIGYGTRIEEFKDFYSRYPHWSMMGKMVADTRMVINDAISRMPYVDTSNIFLVGYSLGGTVALLTSALDSRVKGTAVVCAFDSWRITDKETEGIKHYSHLLGLIPRLGFFENNTNRIPVDFNEILSTIAPRYLYAIAPTQDRHNPGKETKEISREVMNTYEQLKKPLHFIFEQPDTYNHFTDVMKQNICDWLLKIKEEK